MSLNRSVILLSIVLLCSVLHCAGDALHPVKYSTEEAFLKANTHERSETLEIMQKKMDAVRERRKFVPWDSKSPTVAKALNETHAHIDKHTGKPFRPPNIILMLADDLGYGDLSVAPFTKSHDPTAWPCVEGGILSPNLERMAKQGAVMTNFHSAAPVCSPARTAIMTGLYSWRMTAMNAFELGKDLSQRNGFLPQIPTGAEILREHGYFTAHSGKWHLGGMREEQRLDRVKSDNCKRPSPNQHGFEEYVSELDGPESPRYTFLHMGKLHTLGHRYLIKNDIPVPWIEKKGEENVLSDREASDAIQFMKDAQANRPDQPWFVQIWFNAPHTPHQLLKSGEALYNEKYNKTDGFYEKYVCKPPHSRDTYALYSSSNWLYKTMVTAMDKSIGMVLDAVKEMGVEENTLIVFTSDNGQEMGAGSAGMYKEGKRSLMEGGVRVPTLFQWTGKIPANSYSPYFGAQTDLIPTFLDAAGIKKPDNIHFDGISLMSVLTRTTPVNNPEELYGNQFKHAKHLPGEKEIKHRYFNHVNLSHSHASGGATVPEGRVFLWHKDTDPYSRDQRMQSAGYYEYIKVITNTDRGCIDRIFDMRHDPLESNNLVAGHHRSDCYVHFKNYGDMGRLQSLVPSNIAHGHCADLIKHNAVHEVIGHADEKIKAQHAHLQEDEQALNACMDHYYNILIHKLNIILDKLSAFVEHGNKGHQKYMSVDKATCNIPIASEIKSLDYNSGKECPATSKGCSMPEF